MTEVGFPALLATWELRQWFNLFHLHFTSAYFCSLIYSLNHKCLYVSLGTTSTNLCWHLFGLPSKMSFIWSELFFQSFVSWLSFQKLVLLPMLLNFGLQTHFWYPLQTFPSLPVWWFSLPNPALPLLNQNWVLQFSWDVLSARVLLQSQLVKFL